jgi:hypothetical protein
MACGGEVQPLGEVAGGAGGFSGSGGSGRSASGVGGSPTATGGTTAGVGAQEADRCETQCFHNIVNAVGNGCKTCHSAYIKLDMGTLDLGSPGVSARLKDAPAQHKGVTGDTGGCPQGDKLIDSAHPENSWLARKILGQQGTCGTVMPSTGALSLADQVCMVTYVNCVAAR